MKTKDELLGIMEIVRKAQHEHFMRERLPKQIKADVEVAMGVVEKEIQIDIRDILNEILISLQQIQEQTRR